MSAPILTKLLNDGTRMPTLGFGTGTSVHGKSECSDAIVLALQKGFRYIDTAYSYENEESVGIALKKWGGKREDVFICSKWGWSIPDHPHDPEEELRNCLEKMGVDYLDLYLIHSVNPQPYSNVEAWKKMENFKRRGLVRSIGISGFSGTHIEELAQMWTIPPSINQIEYHPYSFHDPRMIHMAETCRKYNIAISPFTALAPLTRFPGGPVDAVAAEIADKRGLTAAQVLLVWASQRSGGGPVVTTASKEWRYQQILDTVHTELSEEELLTLDASGRRRGVQGRFTLAGWNATLKAETA